jgi:hypothetical protein
VDVRLQRAENIAKMRVERLVARMKERAVSEALHAVCWPTRMGSDSGSVDVLNGPGERIGAFRAKRRYVRGPVVKSLSPIIW